MLVVVGLEALVILVLLAALLYGQPAAAQFDRDRLRAYATQVTQLNLPRFTPTPCPPAVAAIRRC